MRVLIACEYSGVVRSAFAAKGHTAVSCDLHLLPRGIQRCRAICYQPTTRTAGMCRAMFWPCSIKVGI